MKVLDRSVVEGTDAIDDLLRGGLADLIGPDMAARWKIRRGHYRPRVLVHSDDDGVAAAALVSGRPATAALKIVDLWYRDGRHVDAMLGAVIAMGRRQGAAVIKWEIDGPAELPEAAAMRGFAPMQPMGRLDESHRVRGYALWLSEIAHTEPRYYAQSTEFTCGAVAALLAAELAGHPGFTGDHGDRRLEIDFWRAASNYPACEPIGLAVALGRRLDRHRQVEVALDPDTPVLLEDFEGFEREFRAELQADSRQLAADLEIPVRPGRIPMTEVAERVRDGETALLLINQRSMHGQDEPHWVAAHASDGTTVVLVQDPWIDRPGGETWVDGHDLPIPIEELERMCLWGAAEHRGVVFLAGA